MNDRKCPVCLATSDMHPPLDYRVEMKYGYSHEVLRIFSGLKILVCRQCGFSFAAPRVSSEDLQRFYSSLYRAPGSPLEYRSQHNKFGRWEWNDHVLSQLLLLRAFREMRPGDSLLDIGSGRGMVFHVARMMGLALKGVAVEPDPYSHSWLRSLGVEIHAIPFEASLTDQFKERKFDCLIMSHVLEHFHGEDLLSVLSSVLSLLSHGAILLCEVPHNDFRFYEKYRYDDTPHLSFFSPESLRILAERAGLNIAFIGEVGLPIEEWHRREISQHYSRVTTRHILRLKSLIREWAPGSARYFLKNMVEFFQGHSLVKVLGREEYTYGEGRIRIRSLLRAP